MLEQSLERLEGPFPRDPIPDTLLVRTVVRLWSKPIQEFSVEDLRITIGQQLGLRFLIPLAIDRLEEDSFAEGAYYPGDLMHAVLSVQPEYWETHRDQARRVEALVDAALEQIGDLDLPKEVETDLRALVMAHRRHLGPAA